MSMGSYWQLEMETGDKYNISYPLKRETQTVLANWLRAGRIWASTYKRIM